MGDIEAKVKIDVEKVNFYYGDIHILRNINMHIYERCITAIIGPSG